jgi:hypothetical protein
MTRDELERIADDSGLGSRSRKKLLDAFDRQQSGSSTTTSPSRPQGHGAPAPDRKRVAAF